MFFACRYWLHTNLRATRGDIANAVIIPRRRWPEADFSPSPPPTDLRLMISDVAEPRQTHTPYRGALCLRDGRHSRGKVRFQKRSTVNALSEAYGEWTYPENAPKSILRQFNRVDNALTPKRTLGTRAPPRAARTVSRGKHKGGCVRLSIQFALP